MGIALRRAGVSDSGDLLRIISLPRRTLDVSKVPDLTPLFRREGSTKQLWPIQSAMLLECEAAQGLVGAVSVGGGKALTSFLLPYAVKSKRTVLFVPAARKAKTLRLIDQWDKDFKIPRDVLRVYSYNDLQGETKAGLLDEERPDFIIADEAHSFQHKDTNRFRRLRKYMHENPATKFAALTGTLTTKSPRDYAHFVAFALKDKSPLPLEWRALEEWCDALEVSDDPLPPGSLEKLCTEKEHDHRDFRAKYFCRFGSSPGVITTRSALYTGTVQVERRACSLPERLQATLQSLRETWQIQGGPEDAEVEVNDALSFHRIAMQLALGFYLRWEWPGNVVDTEWLDARAQWSRSVRHLLRYGRNASLDSFLRISNAAIRRDLPAEHLAVWDRWAAVKDRKKPPTVPRWIDDGMVKDVAAWAREGEGRVVFYNYPSFGEAVAQELGVPFPRSEEELVIDGSPLVLSENIFGTGLDAIQSRYYDMICTGMPNAKLLEQYIGRLAREGQKSKRVRCWLYRHTPEYEAAYQKTLKQSEYALTVGQEQFLWKQESKQRSL